MYRFTQAGSHLRVTEQWKCSPQSAAPALRSPASADVGLEMQAEQEAAAGMQQCSRRPSGPQFPCSEAAGRLSPG